MESLCQQNLKSPKKREWQWWWKKVELSYWEKYCILTCVFPVLLWCTIWTSYVHKNAINRVLTSLGFAAKLLWKPVAHLIQALPFPQISLIMLLFVKDANNLRQTVRSQCGLGNLRILKLRYLTWIKKSNLLTNLLWLIGVAPLNQATILRLTYVLLWMHLHLGLHLVLQIFWPNFATGKKMDFLKTQ